MSEESGVELVSRVMYPRNTSETADEVIRMISMMQRPGVRFADGGGLHVHIDGEGLSLQALQELVLLYAEFEPAVQLLVTEDRRGFRPSGEQNQWFLPIVLKPQEDPAALERARVFAEMGIETPKPVETAGSEKLLGDIIRKVSIPQWRRAVRATYTVEELVELVNPLPSKNPAGRDINGRRAGHALSLINLSRANAASKKPRTVEFRLPKATFSSKTALFWMAFCQLLVAEAENAATADTNSAGAVSSSNAESTAALEYRYSTPTPPSEAWRMFPQLFERITHSRNSEMVAYAGELARSHIATALGRI